jgi:formate/nitrite transporter FocA (FNT family)
MLFGQSYKNEYRPQQGLRLQPNYFGRRIYERNVYVFIGYLVGGTLYFALSNWYYSSALLKKDR